MDKIEQWLREALTALQGKALTIPEILELSDQLEELEGTLGFKMLSDIWISFRCEEADVPVTIDGTPVSVQVCLVPIPRPARSFF